MFDLSQPAEVAAAIAASVGVLTIIGNGIVTAVVAERKLNVDRDKVYSDRAWADYELRRDAYIEVAKWISCLYQNGNPAERPLFHQSARRVRLVGSDGVVRALNAFTAGARGQGSGLPLDQLYQELFNAMRRDIRLIHELPPHGTDLGADAFPIES